MERACEVVGMVLGGARGLGCGDSLIGKALELLFGAWKKAISTVGWNRQLSEGRLRRGVWALRPQHGDRKSVIEICYHCQGIPYSPISSPSLPLPFPPCPKAPCWPISTFLSLPSVLTPRPILIPVPMFGCLPRGPARLGVLDGRAFAFSLFVFFFDVVG